MYRKVVFKYKIITRRQKNEEKILTIWQFTKTNECPKKVYEMLTKKKTQYSYVILTPIIPLEIAYILKTGQRKLFNLRKFGVIVIILESHRQHQVPITNQKEKMSLSNVTVPFVSFFTKHRKKWRALHSDAVQTTQPSGKLLIKSRINRANKYSYNTTSCQSVNSFS